jgi:hypothetical protein
VTVETKTHRVPETINRAQVRKWLPTVVATLIAVAIIFPRSATTVFLLPVIAALAILLFDRHQSGLRLPLNAAALTFICFAVFAIVSALWSAAPAASLSKPLFVLGGAIGVCVLLALAQTVGDDRLRAIGWGVLAGSAVGAALVCIETVTDQALSRFFMTAIPRVREGYDKHVTVANGLVVHVGDANLKRRATVVTMLLLPSALLLMAIAQPWIRRAGLAAVLAVVAIFMTASSHQSSQVAILAALITFGLAHVSLVWSQRVMAVAWCVSCLLVIPIVTGLHGTSVHKNEGLGFKSARHRIVIWNTTAQKIWQAPLVGIGADATATVTEAQAKLDHQSGTTRDGEFHASTARHAHNVFLQVWYELGAIGAVLFTAIGLSVLQAIGRVNARARPYLLAQFAAATGLMSFSFSVWQLWFQGTIGVGILAIMLAVLLHARNEAKAA